MTTDTLYLEGEEEFGPVTSFLFGVGSLLLNKYYNTIIVDLEEKKFNNLLDIGCGNGTLISKLANNFQSSHFYGIDPSLYMLGIAKKKMSRMGLTSRTELKLGSSRSVPFDFKFDAIVSSFSYHHWKERDNSLVNLASHLNDGGFISIYEFNNTSRRYRSSHGIDEKEWAPIEIEGLSKSIIQKNGLIILTLKK